MNEAMNDGDDAVMTSSVGYENDPHVDDGAILEGGDQFQGINDDEPTTVTDPVNTQEGQDGDNWSSDQKEDQDEDQESGTALNETEEEIEYHEQQVVEYVESEKENESDVEEQEIAYDHSSDDAVESVERDINLSNAVQLPSDEEEFLEEDIEVEEHDENVEPESAECVLEHETHEVGLEVEDQHVAGDLLNQVDTNEGNEVGVTATEQPLTASHQESEDVVEQQEIIDGSGEIDEEIRHEEVSEEVYAVEELYQDDANVAETTVEEVYEETHEEVVADTSEIDSSNLEQTVESTQSFAVDDNDYEDVVEVEEENNDEDGGDENVAQHESESDNDQDEDVQQEEIKLGHVSDDDVRDSENDEANVDEEDSMKKTEQDNVHQEGGNQEAIAKLFDSESEDEEGEKEGVGDLIADIFGESDDEDEEFAGFGEDEVGKAKSSTSKKVGAVISDSDGDQDDATPQPSAPAEEEESSSDEGVHVSEKSEGIIYDFDIMLQKKKEERKGRRRRDGGTFISDADDIINAMLTKMKEAADADREANQKKKPALSKLKMLPSVVRHLKKQDLKEAFVDQGMISAAADWLTLLPDRSLPHISIRTELLQILHDLPSVSSETLKTSGIGRAVMLIFKHPRETRKLKESAGRLISKWSRPIFGLNDNFKSMSRGEREQRDLDQMPQSKRRRLSSGRNEVEQPAADGSEPGQLRPGERGFVMRARVPMPSHKDYVVRPKWNVEMDEDSDRQRFNKRSKPRKDERLEKHLKTFAERRKNSKMQRAVGISLEGNKMPLS